MTGALPKSKAATQYEPRIALPDRQYVGAAAQVNLSDMLSTCPSMDYIRL
jgi:hypothetical protein